MFDQQIPGTVYLKILNVLTSGQFKYKFFTAIKFKKNLRPTYFVKERENILVTEHEIFL